jgi:hypothetical protein
MIHLSSLMTKFINLIFYLILILKTISVIIFTYYFVLTKKIKTFNDNIFHTNSNEEIHKLEDIYNNLNTILGLSVAIICVILFNPFFIIDYSINYKIKHMLYYYGVVVIYDSLFRYVTKNTIIYKFIKNL